MNGQPDDVRIRALNGGDEARCEPLNCLDAGLVLGSPLATYQFSSSSVSGAKVQ